MDPSINWALMRTLSPATTTDPSTTASTCNSRAISGTPLVELRYGMTELREITLNAPIFASSVTNASCIPSTKYACAVSPVRFASGNTAIRRKVDAVALRCRATTPRARATNTMATPTTGAKNRGRRGRAGSGMGAGPLASRSSGIAAGAAVGFSRRMASASACVSADGSSSYSWVSRNANAS